MAKAKRRASRRVSLWALAAAISLMASGMGAGAGFAQEAPTGGGGRWAVGVRFPAPFLPPPYVGTDAASSPVAFLQFRLTPQLAVEGGGWLSGYRDPWRESALVLLAGGLRLQLLYEESSELYAAGRGLHARQSSRDQIVCFGGSPPPPSPGPGRDIVPPCPPLESESLTLALEAALGAERKLSAHLAVSVELGAFYAQTITTSPRPSGPPVPVAPRSSHPQQVTGGELTTTLGWGLTLRLGFSFSWGEVAERGSPGAGEG